MRTFHLFAAIFCVVWPGLSSAHELWIEPKDWIFAPGDSVTADIRNGENFAGGSLVWLDRNVARAEAVFGPTSAPITGRAGDRPALATPGKEGLGVLVYETTPSRITYKTWEKFAAFVKHKDLGIRQADHLNNGHPESGFTERYTRHSKALVRVGAGKGVDRVQGLETEFLALSNPYDPTFNNVLNVRLFYQQAPRSNVQIEVFERAPDGAVAVTLKRTDADGFAAIPVKPGHTYLLDAVVLRPGTEDGAIYDTLWAALTFHVPPSPQ